MQVVIREKPQEINVTTVTLGRDPWDKQGINLYMFHCIRCGYPVVQYQGFIMRIVPGMEPAMLPLIVQCANHQCQSKYLFRAIL